MGCCAVILAAFISPRFVLFFMWIFGDRLTIAFDSFWQGLAGFIFLPWTTFAYSLAYAPIGEVSGIGWFFVTGGFVADLATWFGGGREGRSRYADV